PDQQEQPVSAAFQGMAAACAVPPGALPGPAPWPPPVPEDGERGEGPAVPSPPPVAAPLPAAGPAWPAAPLPQERRDGSRPARRPAGAALWPRAAVVRITRPQSPVSEPAHVATVAHSQPLHGPAPPWQSPGPGWRGLSLP